MKPNREDVSKRLKIIKEDLGLSLSEMAQKVGSTKAKIDSYMRALALPPNEVAEKISNLADVEKEWIYYGDRKEFIRAYLISEGYEKIIYDYPQIVDQVHVEYEDRLSFNPNSEFPQLYIIDMIFSDIYSPIFKKYINAICCELAEEIKKYPLYSGSPEYNSDKYLSRVNGLIQREVPRIKYGEDNRVFEIAKNEFNTRVEMFKAHQKPLESVNTDLISYLIEKLETTRGTLEIISCIVQMKKVEYDISSKESDELLEILQEMRPKLVKIKNRT